MSDWDEDEEEKQGAQSNVPSEVFFESREVDSSKREKKKIQVEV